MNIISTSLFLSAVHRHLEDPKKMLWIAQMLSDALNGLRGHLWKVAKLGRDKWQKDDFCCLIYAEKNFEVFRHKELHFPAVSLLLWSFLLPCAVLSCASGFDLLDLGRFSFWGLIGKTWAQVLLYLCSNTIAGAWCGCAATGGTHSVYQQQRIFGCGLHI